MMVTTLTAMGIKLVAYARSGNITLLTVGGAISVIAVWLVVEAFLAVRRYRREGPVESLDVTL